MKSLKTAAELLVHYINLAHRADPLNAECQMELASIIEAFAEADAMLARVQVQKE